LIPLYNSFTPFEDAITAEEFNQFFLDSGFLRSKVSSEILAAENFKEQNADFLKLNIPYFVYLESKKTFLPAVGRSYWTVRPEMGRLEVEKSKMIEGKNHSMVSKIKNRDE